MEFDIKDHRDDEEQSQKQAGTIGRLLELKATGEARNLKVLDAKADPFWTAPARVRDAKWIADLWRERISLIWAEREKKKKRKRKSYARGLHYILVSLGIECPWGKNRRVHASPLYMNVDSDFNKLVGAIRDARNWGLMPWDVIEDRKHVGLEEWVDYGKTPEDEETLPFENFDQEFSHSLEVTVPEVYRVEEASFEENDFDVIKKRIVRDVVNEEMTDLTASRYQPYYIAVVSEKSGMREILRDCLERLDYGFDFLNFEGQASTTVVREFLKKLLGHVPSEDPIPTKKIRIFYLSDYDYAGRVMPPAFIQKLSYQLWELETNLDIKMKPLALTRAIVEQYDVPPAPVPAKHLGAKTLQDRWLREFGRIVEIDALDALHPGVLEDIIVTELEKYIDPDLEEKVQGTLDDIEEEASDAVREAVENRRSEWTRQHKYLLSLFKKVNARIREMGINETLNKLAKQIEDLSSAYKLEDLVSEYEDILNEIYVDYETPQPDFTSDYEADEGDDDWLFDSSRDPEEQAEILREYKP